MKQPEKALYTAKVHTTGGRDGASRSSDGRLEVKLSSPGTPGPGTNPEQMFAAGWSACFEGAMGITARKLKDRPPGRHGHRCRGGLLQNRGRLLLRARLNVSLPGLEREVAHSLVDAAHQTCPSSKATRGNVDVTINVAISQPIQQTGRFTSEYDQNVRGNEPRIAAISCAMRLLTLAAAPLVTMAFAEARPDVQTTWRSPERGIR